MDDSWRESCRQHWKSLTLTFYFIWYVYIVVIHFDSTFEIWSNALVIALVVGVALNANAGHSDHRDNWAKTARFFVIPFCVSSYAALIKDAGFFFIFPTDVMEVITGLAICSVAVVAHNAYLAKRPAPVDESTG